MSKLYKNLLRPLLFKFPTESVHDLGINSLRIGLASGIAQKYARKHFCSDEFAGIERFGLKFSNPVGIAAGFDKNGIVVNQLASLGFGFVEVGTVTYKPQQGNKKPRLFRLPEDGALINRLGFNNHGTPRVIERLRKIERSCVLGVNIGKNKDVPNEEAVENYLKSFDLAFKVADYIAVNVSSPNTPNLRQLQQAESLESLLGALQKRNIELGQEAEGAGGLLERDASATGKPLLVKIAPDLSESEIEEIVDTVIRLKLSGIIATNTTIDRSGLTTGAGELEKIGDGGLSGRPLTLMSNEVIRQIYKYSKGNCPIIGVGGVFTAEDAFDKIAAGACLIQAYTGFVYHGISFASDLNRGLYKFLNRRGFANIDEAIGSESK
ncbi:MAG: quinone-dependent dihydroorotate dehydrogenase [Pyrinomonadaceae bacterium]|nr:quinone-dependent dihydroorotate dehydrogenase [Pyrinomonadaceae bacterium]